jgi:hypothetical protein
MRTYEELAKKRGAPVPTGLPKKTTPPKKWRQLPAAVWIVDVVIAIIVTLVICGQFFLAAVVAGIGFAVAAVRINKNRLKTAAIEAKFPGARKRQGTRRWDRDRSHAYCSKCLSRVYGGEYACEAGHRLNPRWQESFTAKRGVHPERRPGGPNPKLVTLEDVGSSPRGRHDPWFNEVAAAAANLGLFERKRNTGHVLAGIPVEGDMYLDGDGLTVSILIFATAEAARQGEVGLRAKPRLHTSLQDGTRVHRLEGRLLYVGDGRGAFVDEALLDDLVMLVSDLGLPAPVQPESHAPASSPISPSPVRPSSIAASVTEQIRQLGLLRAVGLITEAEFETKKAELLARI